MDNFFILIAAGVLGFIVFCSFWYRMSKQKRAEFLFNNARHHGFCFEGDMAIYPKDKFAPLRLFSLRNQGKMKNVFKREGPVIWIFDYEYSITTDQDVGQTVVIMEIRDIKLPSAVIETRKKERFTVAAMRLLNQKLANWQFSYKEVDCSIHPEFAERYRVYCKDKSESLKKFIHATFVAFLVQNPGWTVETMDQWVLVYRHGEYLKSQEFDIFINVALNLYKLIGKD